MKDGGRRCTSPARTATSTRRGCCWRKARRSTGRRRTAGRRCSPPALTATSTRRGCCWRKARRSIGRRTGVRRRCTPPARRPRRRGAAVAGERRGGRPGDGGRSGRRCTSPARRATSTRRGCCWTKARRSTGRTEDGWTPLYVACQNGHVDAARLLLEKGAEVDQGAERTGGRRCTSPASSGHVDAARLLLEKGAEVDRAAEDGATPLWAACHERPRRRGAAGAGERRGGRPGG